MKQNLGGHRPRFLDRFAVWIVIVYLASTPFLLYTAFRAIQNKTNRVSDWLPENYQETKELDWFRKHFVSDQFVVVSWHGCQLGGDPRLGESQQDDPRIELLARMLVPDSVDPLIESQELLDDTRANPAGLDPEVARRYFKSVTSGRRILNRLTAKRLDVSYPSALSRVQGSLIGNDEHQTCLIVTLTDEAVGNLRAVISRGTGGWMQFYHPEGILITAMRSCGIDPESAHFGGPPVDNVAIDEEGELTLYRLASIAALVGLVLAWWSLRSIRLTLIVFACGLISAIGSLSAIWLAGGTTDSFVMAMPSLVYVLAISGAIHLISYYQHAISETGLADAPRLAIVHGWKPSLLCSVTTAIGLLALCTSELTPIRKFGIYSAFGVMSMLATLFVFLPAALHLWTPRVRSTSTVRNLVAHKHSNLPTTEQSRWECVWRWLGANMIRHHGLVTTFCLLFIGGMGAGVFQIKTSIDLMKLFENQARIRQDYEWLETNVGRLVPIEVVLKFDARTIRNYDESEMDRNRYELLDRLETVSRASRLIYSEFGPTGQDLVSRPLSAATFVPPIPPTGGGIEERVRRRALNRHLENDRNSLINSGYLAIDPETGDELWRISVRVAAFKDVDYGEFTKRLQKHVAPFIEQHNVKLAKTLDEVAKVDRSLLSVTYTGVIPIVYKAQRALLESLIGSTFWSFITITPLLMLVSRGVLAGAVATLPNVLPVLVVFGGLGWLGIPVTLGSMMSASIALGVAVDDTIHYLIWFRKELDRSRDRKQACLAAYLRCANPTLQAAMISGFGFAVFGLSTFTPTRQFGLLMLTILLCGVVAELILLPALLAGTLGRTFEHSPRERLQAIGSFLGIKRAS